MPTTTASEITTIGALGRRFSGSGVRIRSRVRSVRSATVDLIRLDQVIAVEAQIVGVAAQEAERVRASRHRRQIALLEREQVARLDPQMLATSSRSSPRSQALLAQLRAHLAHQALGGVD